MNRSEVPPHNFRRNLKFRGISPCRWPPPFPENEGEGEFFRGEGAGSSS